MSNEQLEQAISLLPEGESFKKVYRAFEGDIRVISEDLRGCEYRYRVLVNLKGNIRIERF